jgi:nucleoside-diphosphate-sugar epimerase
MDRQQIFKQPSFIPLFEDYKRFKGKKICITGAEGVLGKILAERFSSHQIESLKYSGDVLDKKSLAAFFKKHEFDYFFHFAAIVPVAQVEADPLYAFDVNVQGTYNVCTNIIKNCPKCRVFLASSSHVYSTSDEPLSTGSPTHPPTFYGRTKLAAEQICLPLLQHLNISHCIARIFSFGSVHQQEPYLVPTLTQKIQNCQSNDIIEVINPDSVRDIMDAETVVDCVLHLASFAFDGVINIGSGCGLSIREIAYTVADWLGKRIRVEGDNRDTPNTLIANIDPLERLLTKKDNK